MHSITQSKTSPTHEPTFNNMLHTNSQKNKFPTPPIANGNNSSEPYNQISSLQKLNATNEELREMRAFNLKELSSSKDGGLNVSDEVMFYSKIDKQYIYGTICDKKKDKLTKDYLYKITKKYYKPDPDIIAELAKRRKTSSPDDREEIIKLRRLRAKKLVTINWKLNHKFNNESYYKLMEINNFKIELQYALLKLLKSKLKNVIKKNQKQLKLNIKSKKIKKKANREKYKKRRMIKSMSVITDIQSRSKIVDKYIKDKKKNKKRSSSKSKKKKIKNYTTNQKVSQPDGDPLKWNTKQVASWFMWISQNECEYEVYDKFSDFEKKNYRASREGLFDNYALKFVEKEINGIKLSSIDNVALNNKFFVNDKVDRKILILSINKLFNRKKKRIDASNYDGTQYDFNKLGNGSFLNTNKLMYKSSSNANFDKRKNKVGKIKKQTLKEIGFNSNNDYDGTVLHNLNQLTTGDIYEAKVNKLSSAKSFLARKEKLGNIKHKTVTQIGTNDDYVVPSYADDVIAATQIGSATDERSRFGNSSNVADQEFKRLMIEAKQLNITIPSGLLVNKLGFHTKQKQNADIRNYLLKEKRYMMSNNNDDNDNNELKRLNALASARKEFNIRDKKEKKNMLKSGNMHQIAKMYGNKHQIFKKAKDLIKKNEKKERKKQIMKKYTERHSKHESNMERLQKSKINLLKNKKKRKKNIQSHSFALNNIAKQYTNNKKNNKKHSRKRSNSLTLKISDIDDDFKENRPQSAGVYNKKLKRRTKTFAGFKTDKKNKKKKKKVSFMPTIIDSNVSNKRKNKIKQISLTSPVSVSSATSDATVIVNATPVSVDFDDDDDDNKDGDGDYDDNLSLLKQVSNHGGSPSMIIHTNLDSSSYLTSPNWKDDDDDDDGKDSDSSTSSSSSSLSSSLSDDEDVVDDVVDDNNNNNGIRSRVPLTILRLQQQQQALKKSNDDNKNQNVINSNIEDD